MSKAIRVLAMGGTIDKIYFDALSEYQVGEPQVDSIFKDAGLCFDVNITSICHKDSLEITPDDRSKMLEALFYAEESHILITHGTDTMSVSAKAAKQYVSEHQLGKTIVFVGAMNPACFKHSDAPFNVGFALGVLQASSPGVYLAMNGQVFDPEQVLKNRAAGQFQSTDGSTS